MTITLECKWCKKQIVVKQSLANKRKFCSRECTKEYFKVHFAGVNNPAFGKVYRTKNTHPEWAKSISDTCVKNKVNVGKRNAMKRPEVANKMVKTRREKVISNPDYRRNSSEKMKQAWRDGKFDGVRVGQCEWYTHVKSDGSKVRLQGTWEVVYARYLDKNNVTYEAHSKRLKYLNENQNVRSYFPDFFLTNTNEHVDVKGALFYEDHVKKISLVKLANTEEKIKIFDINSFVEVGIDVISEGNSFRKEMINFSHESFDDKEKQKSS